MRAYWIFVVLLFSGCFTKDYTSETTYSPILMMRQILEESVEYTEPRSLVNPGKIYYKDNLIYITELYTGVHVIDNTNPADAKPIAFIKAIGCVDVAIKEDIAYIDNAVDLVAFDLTQKIVVERVKDVFPELAPPDLLSIPEIYSKEQRPANTIIVGWELRKN